MHTSNSFRGLSAALQRTRSAARRQFLEAVRQRAQQELRLDWVVRARAARVQTARKKAFCLDPKELRRGAAAAAA